MTNPLDRRTFLRRGAIGLAGVSVLPAFLAACGDDDEETASGASTSEGGESGGSGTPDYGKLTVQFSWIKNVEFAGAYIANENGWYQEEGFSSVEFLAGGPSVQQDAVVASGKAFACTSSPDIASAAINQGAELIIVGAEYQKNPFCVMSLADNPIATPEDMYGKKVGVQSVNEPVWNAFIEAAGLDASKIEKVPVQFDPQPMVNGEVDGWFSFVTNEPNLLKTQGIDTVTFLLNDHGYPMPSQVIVVQKKTLAEERDKLKAYLRADIRGWRESLKDPELGAKLAAEKYGKDLGLDADEQVLESKAQNELILTDETAENGIFTMSDALIAQCMSSLKVAKIDIAQEDLFDQTLLQEFYEENPDLKASPV